MSIIEKILTMLDERIKLNEIEVKDWGERRKNNPAFGYDLGALEESQYIKEQVLEITKERQISE